jgi:hypothetical protein
MCQLWGVDKVNAIDDLIALMHAHDDDCPINVILLIWDGIVLLDATYI